MKVHSKWVSLQTAIRKVSLMDRDRFCLESKRIPYHRVVRGNYGDIQVFALIGADPVLTYLIAFDFEPESLYRVVEDPEVIARCLKKESK